MGYFILSHPVVQKINGKRNYHSRVHLQNKWQQRFITWDALKNKLCPKGTIFSHATQYMPPVSLFVCLSHSWVMPKQFKILKCALQLAPYDRMMFPVAGSKISPYLSNGTGWWCRHWPHWGNTLLTFKCVISHSPTAGWTGCLSATIIKLSFSLQWNGKH